MSEDQVMIHFEPEDRDLLGDDQDVAGEARSRGCASRCDSDPAAGAHDPIEDRRTDAGWRDPA